MAELLAALQLELAGERAARAAAEAHTVKKSREIWLVREKFEKELRQCQDQLSVVRASLLLVHKQQQQQQQQQRAVPALLADAAPVAAAALDVPGDEPVLGSPRKRKQLPDQVSRAACRGDEAAASVDKAAAEWHGKLPADAAALPASPPSAPLPANGASAAPPARVPEMGGQDAAALQGGSTSSNSSPQQQVLLDVSSQLLSAAGKLQQLVEQLNEREPAAAADLSLLQWELIKAYGQVVSHTATADATAAAAAAAEAESRVVHSLSRQEGECSGTITSEHPLAAMSTPAGPAAAAVQAAAEPAATQAAAEPATAAQEAAAEPAEWPSSGGGSSLAEEAAAAARLFSGASAELSGGSPEPQLSWFWLEEGSRVRGPADAAAMIRWHCSQLMEPGLPVAALQGAVDGSSTAAPPPLAMFRPLGELILEARQGRSYRPFVAVPPEQQPSRSQPDAGRALAPRGSGGGGGSGHFPPAPLTLGLQQIAARLRDAAGAAAGQKQPDVGEAPGSKRDSSSSRAAQADASKTGSSASGGGIAGWILPREGGSSAANSSIMIPFDWWVWDGDVSASGGSGSSSRQSSSNGSGRSSSAASPGAAGAGGEEPLQPQLPVSTAPGGWGGGSSSSPLKPGHDHCVVHVTAVAATGADDV